MHDDNEYEKLRFNRIRINPYSLFVKVSDVSFTQEPPKQFGIIMADGDIVIRTPWYFL